MKLRPSAASRQRILLVGGALVLLALAGAHVLHAHREGRRVLCIPDCHGRECGDDGCGGSCGRCEGSLGCGAEGRCDCESGCSGRQCGSDGCLGTCGSCPPGYGCQDARCVCEPDCEGRACGPDGCSGTCGTCAEDEVCGREARCEDAPLSRPAPRPSAGAACRAPGWADLDAPWPVFGGCPGNWRRSTALGPDTPELAWRLRLDGTDVAQVLVASDGSLRVLVEERWSRVKHVHGLYSESTGLVSVVQALDPDGRPLWKRQFPSHVAGAVLDPEGNTWLAAPGGVVVLDGAGEVKEHRPLPSGSAAWPGGLTLLPEGVVVMATEGMRSKVGGGPGGLTVFSRTGAGQLSALGKDGLLLWVVEEGHGRLTSPVSGPDGHILTTSDGGGVRAVGLDGGRLWRAAPGAWGLFDAATVTQGRSYVLNGDRELVALDDAGVTLWSTELDRSAPHGPAIRTDGGLVLSGSACYPTRGPECEYRSTLLALTAEGVESWSVDEIGTGLGSLVLDARDRAFVGASDGRLRSYDREGRLLWDISVAETEQDQPPKVHALDGSGRVIGSLGGELFVVGERR